MTDDTDDHFLAQDYVLGAATREERTQIRRRAAGNRRLADAIDGLERRLAPLADLVPEEVPPPSLWEQIERAVTDPAEPPTLGITVFADHGSWRPVARGVEMKLLSNGGGEGIGTYLLRCGPGARLPAHGHDHPEELFVIQGDVEMGALRLGEGDYHRMPAGSMHPVVHTPNGCLLFMRGSLTMRPVG